jgi:predicted TIM-barrel fold metal-dependent hydrolase
MEYHLDPIFNIAGENGLAVKLFAGWGARSVPMQWEKYVRRHPKVTFVVLHIGGIDFGYGSIPFVGAYPNLMFETSGQLEMQVLHKAFDDLPIEKFVFGSNYPAHITQCSIDVFDALDLDAGARKKLFEENAERLLKR